MSEDSNGEVLLYEDASGGTPIEVRLESETVWRSQQQIASLFETSRENVVQHLRNIYEDGELQEVATCKKFLQVRQEGRRQVRREVPL